MKVLCIGNVSYDITVPMDGYPKENIKYRVEDRVECGGGPASNAAYLLGKWDNETYFAGVVGDDLYGHKILKEFEDVNVNVDYLEMTKEHETTSAFIIANKRNGSRTVFTHRDPNIKMSELDLDFEPDVILTDGQEVDNTNLLFDKYPDAIKIIDAGRAKDPIIDIAKRVHYLVCSKQFAEQVTNININYTFTNTIVEAYNKLREEFPGSKIIITLEDKGCVYEKDGIIRIMPSLKVKPVDSTGAGDIFHGAFTYAIANNFPLEKAIRYGNIAGALSVTKVGGRYSVPTLEEVENKYASLKPTI